MKLCPGFWACSLGLTAVLAACSPEARLVKDGPAAATQPNHRPMITWPAFEELKRLTGTNYQSHRDTVLRTNRDLDARLQPVHEIQPWESRVTAAILIGWRAHASLYTAVLAELDAIDIEWERKKVTGVAGIWEDFALRAHQEYKITILPLCWEAILKHPEWPQWKLVTFVRMMEAVPHEDSIQPLLTFIESTPIQSMQDVAAQALKRQPAAKAREGIQARLLATPPPPPPVADALRRTLGSLQP